MEEYERVREEIKSVIQRNVEPYSLLTKEVADQILSLDGIRIEADEQSLPCNYSQVRTPEYGAMVDMLKAGFVKVIPKEEKDGS
jgi:hypothetical protein